MYDELLQFKLQKVWTLVDLPYGKRDIGTKWVYRNKKDDRDIVVRNKARLVAQDVKSAFLYGTIEEEVYVCQHPGFEDPEFPNKIYKVKQKDDEIFISQDKYMADILKKFDFATVKTASTPMETNKALLKDEEAADVDVHLYRSMIGSLMYLTASRPDIMFAVCACARLDGARPDSGMAKAEVHGVLYYGTYGVCIGILACRGLSLVSSPLHAMKSQTQIQSSAAVKFGGVTDWYQSHLVIEN
ncbi:putative ribonuclease H-like domain-containing protein [Tanacetum coccineum]